MSYIDYIEKLIGIQGVELKEPIKTSENEIEIEFRLKRKACKCPCCNNLTDRIHPAKKERLNAITGCCEDLFQKAKALMTTQQMRS